LNLVPYLNYSLVADRYFYLPSAGFFLWLGRMAQRWTAPGGPPARHRALWGAALLATGYAVLGMRHAQRFADPLAVWSHTVRCAPDNARAHFALGCACRARGLLPEAAFELRKAVTLDPGHLQSYEVLSWAYAGMGRWDDAIAASRQRLAVRADPSGWLNLGALLLTAGRFDEALPPLRRAVELDPASADARLDLGLCLIRLRRWGEAFLALRPVALSPSPSLSSKALSGLGDIFAARGDHRQSALCYSEALRRDPSRTATMQKLASARRRSK
jgi:tetratricopeptide (TPR) repeat protein